MYIISIYEELKLEEYKKIIDFAFSKSDTFMSVTFRYSDQVSLPDRKVYENEEEFLRALSYFEKAQEERSKRKSIFKNSTEPFLEKLEPYLVKKRKFPTEWPGSKVVFFNRNISVDICVYKVCDQVKTYLLEPKGLFNWKYPYFPDDLCFFNNGYCWFYIVAHEGYAYMYVKNAEDVEKLRKIGLKFEVTKCNDNEVNLFYEDYNL